MRVDQIRQHMWLAATGMFFLSLFVAAANRTGILSPFRPAIHDALSPGRLIVMSMRPQAMKNTASLDSASRHAGHATGEDAIDENHKRSERLLRQLMIENARLRRDLKRERTASVIEQSMAEQSLGSLNSVTQFELVPASIVSSSGLPTTLKELIVDAGKSAGITRSELVVDGQGAILDAGIDKGVAAGDRVLTGAVLVGRVEKSARWVSLIQPITDPEFRAQVVVMRQTPDGLLPGTLAMLEGTGDEECVLTGIPHTEAVAEGDEVVTADVNGVRGPQLYIGRVTRAEFLAGGQWDVRVLPAARLQELDHVGILRLRLTKAAK